MKRAITVILQKLPILSKKRAFTLIEILVTISIIGILATVGLVGYQIALQRSHDQQRLTDVETIANALERFYLDNKHYPEVAQNSGGTIFNASYQLDSALRSGCGVSGDSLTPTYIGSIPQDPTNKLSLQSSGGNCSVLSQNGQYLYTAVVDSASEAPHNYVLAAKMERTSNMSSNLPIFGAYVLDDLNSSLNLCTSTTTDQTNCASNFYLGPKNGQ